MRQTLSVAALAALTLALPGAGPALAQGEGSASVSVTVKDSYGVIPGATVRVLNKGTQAGSRAVSDSRGQASFGTLAAGTYAVKASLTGFVDFEQTFTLGAGEQKAVDALLSQVQFSTTVTVSTANRREQLLLDVAEPTTLIDEAQILDTGSRTAKDLLVQQSGSGVQVNAGGGQGHMSINGIPNSGVLVLVDGRRFLGRDANGNFNLEEIALAGIERVEIVKGPGSALYGADALGGVVNFITKQGKDPGWRNNLSLLGGSYSDFRVNDTIDYRHAKGGVSVYGSHRTYDGFDLDKANPQTIGQPGSKFWNGGLSADYQFSSRVVGRLFADYNDRHMDPYFFSGATQLASTVYNSIRDLKRYMLSPELEVLAGSKTSFNAAYNYGKYTRDETQVFTVGGRTVEVAPWREWNNEFKLTGRHSWSLGGREHPLQAGYEHRTEKLRRATLTVADPERKINVFWAQQELDLGRVKLSGGFRNDDYSDFGSQLSPKGSVLVNLGEGHRLRASVGEGFRPPYFGELYLNTPPFFVGNPNLKPERVKPGWTTGYAYAGPKAQLSADYFESHLENGIVFDLTGFPFTYGNLRKYTSKGVNTSAAASLPYGLTPSLDYTYNKRADDTGAEIGGYPKHTVYAKLLWANPRLGLRANLRAEFTGKIPPGTTDTSFQPAYQVWNAQLNKTFARRGAYAVSAWLQASNIFDRRDIYRQDLSGNPLVAQALQIWIAPRTFQGGITVDMDWTR